MIRRLRCARRLTRAASVGATEVAMPLLQWTKSIAASGAPTEIALCRSDFSRDALPRFLWERRKPRCSMPPLPLAGEGEGHRSETPRALLRLPSPAPLARPLPQVGEVTAVPPLPLAGEGWGEGNRSETPNALLRLPSPAPAARPLPQVGEVTAHSPPA